MHKERDQLIIAINNLFDENNRLANQIEKEKMLQRLSRANDMVEKDSNNKISNIYNIIYEIGEKELYKSVVSYWDSSKDIKLVDESPESFEEWRDHYLDKTKLPFDLSYTEFINHFEDELHQEYNEQLEIINKKENKTNE